MIRNYLSRINSRNVLEVCNPCFYYPLRLFSDQKGEMNFNDQQASYYTAKDVEFCPNRAKEVMQNYVQETSDNASNDDFSHENRNIAAEEGDKDHVDGYKSGISVSLYSVMQSNVPEPFTTSDEVSTHLNMPGSSSSQDCKYLSGKIQNTHQSKQ